VIIASQTRSRHPLVRVGLWFAIASLTLAGVVLFLFNPAQHHFYPICLFHEITGLDCPGCGATRALYNLLHGRIFAALQYNALVVLATPFLSVAGMRWLARDLTGKPHPPLQPRPLWINLAVALIILFTILRNLPVAPFTFLRAP
jgi:hypothetical protein